MQEKRKAANILIYSILTILSVIFIIPIALVIMNSLKNKLYISTSPFALPDSESFRGLKNYIEGLTKIHFMDSIGYSLFITVVSVIMIIVFCSMTAWYITRVKNKLTSFIYFLFIASMVVPFQMVMYTMTKVANMTHLDNFIGINVLYLGFGSSMAVFMFTGFVKGIPIELEEAGLIDGCNPLTMFVKVVFPVLKPISITIAILNAMWIWNDFLLPSLVLSDKKLLTLPLSTYSFYGTYSADYGTIMAGLLLCVVPILVLYVALQKQIIGGVVAGAVK